MIAVGFFFNNALRNRSRGHWIASISRRCSFNFPAQIFFILHPKMPEKFYSVAVRDDGKTFLLTETPMHWGLTKRNSQKYPRGNEKLLTFRSTSLRRHPARRRLLFIRRNRTSMLQKHSDNGSSSSRCSMTKKSTVTEIQQTTAPVSIRNWPVDNCTVVRQDKNQSGSWRVDKNTSALCSR